MDTLETIPQQVDPANVAGLLAETEAVLIQILRTVFSIKEHTLD